MQCRAEDIAQLIEYFLKMYKVLSLIPSTYKTQWHSHDSSLSGSGNMWVQSSRSFWYIYQIQGQSKIHKILSQKGRGDGRKKTKKRILNILTTKKG